MAAADWSNLNRDMIEKIAEEIDLFADYLRVRALCLNWRSSLSNNPNHLQQPFPSLLVPHPLIIEPTSTPNPCLFNPLISNLVHLPSLPTDVYSIASFSKGWVIALEKNTPSICLINPFTTTTTNTNTNNQMQIHYLPPIYTFPRVLDYNPNRVGDEFLLKSVFDDMTLTFDDLSTRFLHKVVLSSSLPNTKNFIAMALFGEFSELAYCRHGDKSWNIVRLRERPGQEEGEARTPGCFKDVVYFRGNFYAVGNGQVFGISYFNSSFKAVQIFKSPGPNLPHQLYLVESSYDRDLLLVARYTIFRDSFRRDDNMIVARNLQWRHDGENYYQSVNFEIFKLNIYQLLKSSTKTKTKLEKRTGLKTSTHTRLPSLGNQVLFLGKNESWSLPSHSFPGCNGNHIYFCDEFSPPDIGVFDYKGRDLYPIPNYRNNPLFLPIWVMRHNC